jgi:hypothetical protein
MKKELTFNVKFTNVPDRIYSTVMSETEFKTEISLDWNKHLEFAESTLAELTACFKVYAIFDDIKARVIAEYEEEQRKIKNGSNVINAYLKDETERKEAEKRKNEDKGPY